ncbi:MAG: hypothetical protein QOK25_2849 [Thermoleophilaceae bacterium]|nr:hypothetical protein [Thermoleophilaceae bacterium]
MSDLEPGTEFAGHRIEEVAGRGGMGVVYRAVHLALNRPVALKLIAPELADSPDFRARFQRECEIAASLDHPNVIPIYGAGDQGGRLWVTMRYVDGTDLLLLSAGSPLDPRRAARIVAEAAGALDAAHARGLVHRDVKPGNVLIEEGPKGDGVFLTDFGLTKEVSSDPGLTKEGNWQGTADFAAPEQIRGDPVDARADIYALGGVLFHALTGRSPYAHDDDLAKMHAHLDDPPPSLADAAPGVPIELDAVIQRAMAKDAADRYPSAGDLGRAAMAAATGRSPAAPEGSVAAGAAAPAELSGDGAAAPDAAPEPTRIMPTDPNQPTPVSNPVIRSTPSRTALRPRLLALGALVVAIVATLVATGAFSGGGRRSTAGPVRPARPARPAVVHPAKPKPKPTPRPASSQPSGHEVTRLLKTYAAGVHSKSALGLGALLAPNFVRRNFGESPLNRSQAIAAYRREFALGGSLSYVLKGVKVKRGPGTATVTGRYTVKSSTGTSTGTVVFHLVERHSHLVIKALETKPG